ncbi:ComEC/Rec2 family competence protein [Flavobacterium terrae]|uniref:Competence protein ComEC n=1 Tax=Flavobacterium terrae TaxID=415425 RepID=A0A1M6BLG7_9FLAO|nr:ComEC/Rec2 family competence protein [Flavobacterium terrae]SHI49516.1 competence protein ComEC [Flavobacterium terrae]
MKIQDFPIAKITASFILGILISNYLEIGLEYYLVSTIFCLTLFYFSFYKSNKKIRQTNTFGIITILLFFSIGALTTVLHDDRNNKNHYSHINNLEDKHKIVLITREKLKSTTKSHRYYADVIKIGTKNCFGKVILNLKKDKNESTIVSGSKIYVLGTLTEIQKPNNPNQFDYSNYLKHKNIYAQIYSSTNDIKVDKQLYKDIYHYVFELRENIIQRLKINGFQQEELAVLNALILGQKQDISPDTQKDYQNAGAVHILSVSGMHVGFIMLFITFLLKPLPNNKKSNLCRIFIILISLWIFAFIAGLSPSVVRSVTMFSFITFGSLINRQNNMFHTIIVSLFIILLIEPGFLFDIGFQLSYLALFFIIWFQPMLKNLWSPKQKINIYLWDILTVSTAAQIGTLPLSIYYFHQFPGLFFVTNLVLVPMIFIIMILGSLLMIFSLFDYLPIILLKLVEGLIYCMNVFINKIASVELFVLKNIPLSVAMLITSYIIAITIINLLKKFNYVRFALTLSFLILFQILLIQKNWETKKGNNLIVFSSRNKTIIGFKKGETLEIASNSKIENNSFEKNTIDSYVIANFITNTKTENLKNFYYFDDKKIVVLDSNIPHETIKASEVIILRNSPKINLERLLENSNPKIIIADGSNYKSYIKLWAETCRNKNIPFHSTYEKGYYKL